MIKNLIIDLCKSNLGCIFVWNLLKSIENGLVNEMRVKLFLKNCADKYDPSIHKTPNQILVFINAEFRKLHGTENDIRFLCQNITTKFNKKGKYCAILPYDVFVEHLADRTCKPDNNHPKIKSWGSPVLSFPTVGKKEWDSVFYDSIFEIKLKLKNDLGKDNYIGQFSNSFFWVTCHDILQERIFDISLDEKAHSVRDLLGLIHYPDSEDEIPLFLVGMLFSNDSIKQQKSARPVFINAITHSRFKTIPDSSINRRRSGWGCTVDLNKFLNCNEHIDGLIERVVESIATKKIRTIKTHFLGNVTVIRGEQGSDNNEAFLNQLLNDETKTIMIETLMDKLNEITV